MEDIPQLTEAYEKARKQYGLFAALLMAWEIVGIELTALPISSVDITLRSPQAVPFVLMALVGYFAFRVTIEWHQSNAARRSAMPSKLDFWTAHGIAILAAGIFGFQSLSGLQLANESDAIWLVPGFMLGISVGGILIRYRWFKALKIDERTFPKYLATRWPLTRFIMALYFSTGLVLIPVLLFVGYRTWLGILYLSFGFVVGIILAYFPDLLERKVATVVGKHRGPIQAPDDVERAPD